MCPNSSDFSKLSMDTGNPLSMDKTENCPTRVRARVLDTKKNCPTRAHSLFKREERGKYLNDFPSLGTYKKTTRAGQTVDATDKHGETNMRLRLEDLPPSVRAQAERQIAEQDAARARLFAPKAPGQGQHQATAPEARRRSVAAKREPNKTEDDYNRRMLGGAGRYEALTLRLPGGSRYTPDWVSVEGGLVVLHEVKGAYRLHSQGRALTAWKEAVAAFPEFGFVWAVKGKDGNWEVTRA